VARGSGGQAPIQPVGARTPLVDQVTARVLDHIRSNNLVPGTRLPSTAEMARAFRVAPTTLREALSRLETTGVTHVRHGVGVCVKSVASRLVLLNPQRLRDEEGRLVDLRLTSGTDGDTWRRSTRPSGRSSFGRSMSRSPE
jgi:GntR family transcriptional regulator, transcriptional repressor for pyruvate dehydrogenase complex